MPIIVWILIGLVCLIVAFRFMSYIQDTIGWIRGERAQSRLEREWRHQLGKRTEK